jgi:hypothetical protein
MRQAEQKSGGTPPLIVRIRNRVVRYEALWHGKDLPRAVSIIIDVIEINQGVTLDVGRPADGVPNNITLLCGRNCQALLSALSSLPLDTAPPLLIIRLSHAHTGSVDE